MRFNRSAFLTGSLAVAGSGLSQRARGATPAPPGASPEMLLGRLMAGNKRFVDNDFPPTNMIAEKRALVTEGQSPYAAILGCADSRVIPEFVFVQGIGQLFVARVAGNYPDALVTGSLEYAIENLGSRVIMVLGHQGCGAVKAVYAAAEKKEQLPPHLSSIQEFIAPGIAGVVAARGGFDAAIEANARASARALRASSPIVAKAVDAGRVRLAASVYHLRTGEVQLLG